MSAASTSSLGPVPQSGVRDLEKSGHSLHGEKAARRQVSFTLARSCDPAFTQSRKKSCDPVDNSPHLKQAEIWRCSSGAPIDTPETTTWAAPLACCAALLPKEQQTPTHFKTTVPSMQAAAELLLFARVGVLEAMPY